MKIFKFIITLLLHLPLLSLIFAQTCSNSTKCYTLTLENLETARQKYLDGFTLLQNLKNDIKVNFTTFDLKIESKISAWKISMQNEISAYINSTMPPLQENFQA